MSDVLINSTTMTNIANAIRQKNGTQDTYLPSEMPSAIIYEAPATKQKDVNFYDYDGTITNSYTAQEFLALNSLPANPDRTSEGLTAEGWNWSLSDAKSYVASYGKLNVGQTYHTTDGKYHIWFNGAKCNLSNIDSGTVINWGDGTTETASDSSISHIYSGYGEYEITVQTTSTSYIKVNTGVIKIFAPNSITNIGFYVFQNCYSLQNITIPNSVTSIGQYAFHYTSLQNITIPNSVAAIDTFAFYYTSLQNITIPNSVTNISGRAFSNCDSLQNITIPNSVTDIGVAAFEYCRSLSNITIPNSVTSIRQGVFANCYSLQNITIPKNVAIIVQSAFSGCPFIYMTIKATTPPTLSETIETGNLQAIYVPAESVDTYKAASGWSDYASYIQAEPSN